MGGYQFTPQWVKVEGEWKLLILPSPSKASKKKIMDKIRSLKLPTRTGSIYVVANLLNPLVRGWQNYYCYFIKRALNDLFMALCEQATGEMVQMEQADEFVQEPQMAAYIV